MPASNSTQKTITGLDLKFLESINKAYVTVIKAVAPQTPITPQTSTTPAI